MQTDKNRPHIYGEYEEMAYITVLLFFLQLIHRRYKRCLLHFLSLQLLQLHFIGKAKSWHHRHSPQILPQPPLTEPTILQVNPSSVILLCSNCYLRHLQKHDHLRFYLHLNRTFNYFKLY